MLAKWRFWVAIVLCCCMRLSIASDSATAVENSKHPWNVDVELRAEAGEGRTPYYRVRSPGGEVVHWSRLGVDLAGGERLGGPCEIVSSQSQTIHDDFVQFPGKRRHVVGDAQERTFVLRETTKPNRQWELIVREYDDGVCFRYRFPAQDGWNELAIAGERTEFNLQEQAKAIALPLNSFTTSHEQRYQARPIGQLPQDWLLGLPLLVQVPCEKSQTLVAITEANINEYAGMYLAPRGNGKLGLRLSPLPDEPNIAVRARLPHVSPWRVIMLGDDAAKLVESDLMLKLNDSCQVADTSWIKPGKTTFPWWNGFYEEHVAFRPGLNTATMKYYIDFCAESGIPYHSLDGIADTAWYGGPIVPYRGADPTRSLPEIDLPEVLRYAKEKGVRLRLWMHWQAARDHMQRSFPIYRQWGIEGVMLDFMDRDDQRMYRFIREAVKLAAENHLTITLHGCPQPSGLERTYPNLLTHEAVMNLEYDKWDKQGISPRHETTVPFTRMLAGPLDFHQGSLRTVRAQDFRPRNEAPLVIGTPCHTLASYVVYQNHLSMVADYPSAYRSHPALPVLVQIPSTWDETRLVDGEVGQHVAIARRDGNQWHLGVMNGETARRVSLPLTFLGPGSYTAEFWRDDAQAEHGLSREDRTVSAEDTLDIDLAASGGAYLRLIPKK